MCPEILDFTRKRRGESEKKNEKTIAIWLHNIYTENTSGAKWGKVEQKTTNMGGEDSDQRYRYLRAQPGREEPSLYPRPAPQGVGGYPVPHDGRGRVPRHLPPGELGRVHREICLPPHEPV
ncbi:hypothetical protein KL86CLO1_10704 [uncultured Eubacteriales bacterium]|uniref:Uncharacterized protein n=1 Tax=uncultured Eubacteriales bacterium TaxID=172733 RepID=A0A212J8W5_9FIRM|nr:hypothetical protein KL86CLO1_10704 [uncultured Eubacteriales bacterium]